MNVEQMLDEFNENGTFYFNKLTALERLKLLQLAQLGKQMQWFTENCPDDYGFITNGICPADRDCANCWLSIFSLLPNPKEEE